VCITVEKDDVRVFLREQTASFSTLTRRISDNTGNMCTVVSSHHVDCIYKMNLQIVGCLAFARSVVYVDRVSLVYFISNGYLLL
jgi:hypothetical protein